MASYINRRQENPAGIGEKQWVPVNRWAGPANFTVMTVVDGVATYTLETTIDQLNRDPFNGVAETVCPVVNAIDLTADACLNITNTPSEAFRINQTAGTGSVIMKIMQNGEGG